MRLWVIKSDAIWLSIKMRKMQRLSINNSNRKYRRKIIQIKVEARVSITVEPELNLGTTCRLHSQCGYLMNDPLWLSLEVNHSTRSLEPSAFDHRRTHRASQGEVKVEKFPEFRDCHKRQVEEQSPRQDRPGISHIAPS